MTAIDLAPVATARAIATARQAMPVGHAGRYGMVPGDTVTVSVARQDALARVYLALPAVEPSHRRFWDAMARDVDAQYAAMIAGGITHHVSDSDPYGGPLDLFHDVAQGRIVTWSSRATGGHPLWSEAQNDRFRAVHDVFGHCAGGHHFDRDGEERAYQRHRLMFSAMGSVAMATETRGQNAALHFLGEFADERIAALPEEWRRFHALED